MNRVIKLSPSAILDLVKIYNYYYEDLVNPTAERKSELRFFFKKEIIN